MLIYLVERKIGNNVVESPNFSIWINYAYNMQIRRIWWRLEHNYSRYLCIVCMWQLPRPSEWLLLSRKLFEASVFGSILIKIEILLVIVAFLFRFTETKIFAFASTMNVKCYVLKLDCWTWMIKMNNQSFIVAIPLIWFAVECLMSRNCTTRVVCFYSVRYFPPHCSFVSLLSTWKYLIHFIILWLVIEHWA